MTMPLTTNLEAFLPLLRCPVTGNDVTLRDGKVIARSGGASYEIDPCGVVMFAESEISKDARKQQEHYDRIASAYVANLGYPHTHEYMGFLDRTLRQITADAGLGRVAEICCGRGEAFQFLGEGVACGIGVDISLSMLKVAVMSHDPSRLHFVQGDATNLPLHSGIFDSVFMLGGIHHVNDRGALFSEVARVLKSGGRFYFREPVNDFALWRLIRNLIYRVSSGLDRETEAPLRYHDTLDALNHAGLRLETWNTHGFLGFCLFMNSDILVFNRLFRFVPGIRNLTRWSTHLDEWIVSLPGLGRAGLQVVGCAIKSPECRSGVVAKRL